MDQNNFGEVISSLFQGMDAMLASQTVVGQPTKVGDTVLVPLVDVTLGVGAGASSADKKNSGTGGFGAKMTPNAILIIRNGQTKLVHVRNQDVLTKVLDLIPDMVDRFAPDQRGMMSDDDAKEVAFREEMDGEK